MQPKTPLERYKEGQGIFGSYDDQVQDNFNKLNAAEKQQYREVAPPHTRAMHPAALRCALLCSPTAPLLTCAPLGDALHLLHYKATCTHGLYAGTRS